jgi:orotidine-5'-phosphate decarboxylase
MTPMSAREKLIVALDCSSANQAARAAEKLRGRVGMFKVGLELFTAEGPVIARYLLASGDKVFLDLKFHDIPNTVRAAAREAAGLGVSMLNVHASGGRKMMEAALDGARSAAAGRTNASGQAGATRPLVLAVTVLTSLASEDLGAVGIADSPEDAVVRLAQLAQKAGLDGVVASPREIAAVRRACGPQFLIVAPGIRPRLAPGARSRATTWDDQTRIATPESAIRAGADYLVVGRPITEASDLAAAAEAIVHEMEKSAS